MARLSLEPLEPFLFNHRSGDLVSFANPPQSHTSRTQVEPSPRRAGELANGTRSPTNLPQSAPNLTHMRPVPSALEGDHHRPHRLPEAFQLLGFASVGSRGLIARASHRAKALSNAVAMEENATRCTGAKKKRNFLVPCARCSFFFYFCTR